MTRPWGEGRDEVDAAREELTNDGHIVPTGAGFGWGEAVDSMSRMLLTYASSDSWKLRAVINGRAYLLSADGRRECYLVMRFEPAPHVVSVHPHDGRKLTTAEALDYLGGLR